MKRGLNSGNASYDSFQNLPSQLLLKNLKIIRYKTIILPLVPYGCETRPLTLREEHRLGVFENRVLRRLFGPKTDKVTGEWRKLHNDELHDLYSLSSIIGIIKARRIRWAGHVARMGAKRTAYKLLVGNSEGRRTLGRPCCRWLDNIRMDLVQVGCSDVDWIGLAQDKDRWRAAVNSVLNLRVPYTAGKLSSILTTRDLSSSAQLHGVS
jgi:hypothetical protein